MNIDIRLDPSRVRRWHDTLVRRLDATPGLHVCRISLAEATPPPSAVALLLRLEALLQRRGKAHPSDAIAAQTLTPAHASDETPDLVVDLSGADCTGSSEPVRLLRPLYDGCAGEDALLTALVDGQMPVLEIERRDAGDTAGHGEIVAAAVPSGECAQGIGDGIEAVAARFTTALIAVVSGRGLLQPGAAGGTTVLRGRTRTGAVAKTFAKGMAYKAARALYGTCCHTPHWRIGWRWVTGEGVWDRHDLEGGAWHTLADPGYAFYADPVPFVWQGRTFVFFEDLDHRTEKGVISMVEMNAHGPLGPVRTVLEESWHLSYPFLIEHAGEVFMIPESSSHRDVNLYRAVRFPDRWERVATLLSDLEAGDATLVEHGGRHWMFAATREGGGGWSDTLSLFHAPDLFGPWTPHVGNPLLIDRAAARPAGNIVSRGGRLWRPVQDCSVRYGGALGLAEVTRLDEEGYEQVVHKVLQPGPAWPGRRLHTLNRAGALECIDGSATPVKLLSRRPRTTPAQADVAWPEPAAL